ncbi:MAG: hypothetical protein KBD78_09905 [Oligoflexales bacterium]|nr:hypothetical protein [Oligoflexales bacterium]
MAKLAEIISNNLNDGLSLAGSLLCLDALDHGDVSFLSSAAVATRKPKVRIICTEQTHQLLGVMNKNIDALVCQYNRPFSLGDLKLELLPSGALLGGASLFIETVHHGRVLYAPHLQTKHIPMVRKFQLKKAETLIIGAYSPSPNTQCPSRKKELQRLLASLESSLAQNKSPKLVCMPFGTAQELSKIITDADLPLELSPQILRINKIYEAHGSPLGQFQAFGRRSYSRTPQKTAVRLMSPEAWQRWVKKTGEGSEHTYYVDDVLNPVQTGIKLNTLVPTFHIGSTSIGAETREVIAAVQPKQVYLFGPYAKTFAKELGEQKYHARVLYDNAQPTLI